MHSFVGFVGAASSITSIATAAHPLCAPRFSRPSQACFSFAHHSHHLAPYLTPKKSAISPLLFAPPLMQEAVTESLRLQRIAMMPDELSECESIDSLSKSPISFDDLAQKLPDAITFFYKDEISGLLSPEHAIQRERSKEAQSFLDQFTPEEKALLKEKLIEVNPKLSQWTAHQNAFLLVKAGVSKESLTTYLTDHLGTFISPDALHLFIESSFEEKTTSSKSALLDLTPLMKLTAKHFLNETLLNDRHLKNLQQLATADSSTNQLFGNFFSFINTPKKSTIFKAAGLVATLKADDAFYWMQQKVAVSQNKLPQWLANSEFLATEKINFEESILKAYREQGPSVDVDTIKQTISG